METWGLDIPRFEAMSSMRFQLSHFPQRILTLDTTSQDTWIASLKEIFPADIIFLEGPFRKMGQWAIHLKEIAEKSPHYPIQSWTDLRLNFKLLRVLPPHIKSLLRTEHLSFARMLEEHNLSPALKEWINMNLLITTQCTANEIYTPWAALALFFYTMGAGTTLGGMRGLMESLMRGLLKNKNAKLKLQTRVHSFIKNKKHFYLNIQRINQEVQEEGPFDVVISSLPRFNTQALSAHERIFESHWDWENQESTLWGAVTAYVGLQDSPHFPQEAFNVHSKISVENDSKNEGSEAYMSFSKRGDTSRSPEGTRVATLSCHTRLKNWRKLQSEEAYLFKKQDFQRVFEKQIENLKHMCQGQELQVFHIEIGTPKTFEHYTGRREGNVGGLPMTRSNTLLHAPSQRTFIPALYQIGDTSFPGQSVYACALGAISCIEKINYEAL